MRKFVEVSQASAWFCPLRMLRNGEKAALHVIFSPLSSVIQLKWVFLTAFYVELSGEFELVLSR